MKSTLRLLLLLGMCVFVLLLERGGIGSILALLSRAGWLLLFLLPLHAMALVLDVFGWRALIRGPSALSALFRIACVREAINRLLPVANVGGEIVGVRLLAPRGPGLIAAASSVIVETLMSMVSQLVFVACGLACLWQIAAAAPLAGRLSWALVGAIPAPLLAALLLRDGRVFRCLGRLAHRLLGEERAAGLSSAGTALEEAIRELLKSRIDCARAVAWQFAGLLVGCAETWIVLSWLGHPIGPAQTLALESVTQAVRHFVFIVPAALGVQEAALVAVGHLAGLDMDVALALSLAKRARELLFGLPAILIWQWSEGRGSLTAPGSGSL